MDGTQLQAQEKELEMSTVYPGIIYIPLMMGG